MNEPIPVIDTTVPSMARIYDYCLGGKDNFAVDREAAEQILRVLPNVRQIARENREFLGRAVRFLTEAGIRQFLDIGTGLPTQQNVHEVALGVAPDVRTVYVDNDPIVLTHARALLANHDQTIVAEGDLRSPRDLLGRAEVRAHLDFDRPFAIILCSIVHFVEDDEAAGDIVSILRESLPAGGAFVLSHGFRGMLDDEAMEIGRSIYARAHAGVTMRDWAAIMDYFRGLELVEPGLVRVESWRPDHDLDLTTDAAAPGILGAVAFRTRL
ncbi:SAM-dependent methyltransferase [Nonomuraea sp. NBC_00507]|uniref:SAM-dependent methyltransferase n=1 Tax=Nonomuraea sp. NBC_00507 TaxID=2976002 RepID=UPI002E17785A